MLVVHYKKRHLLPVTEYYLGGDKNITPQKRFIKSVFRFRHGDTHCPKYVKKYIFNTGQIDLKNDIDTIFRRFSETTRNEIKRSTKEGVLYEHIIGPTGDDLQTYILYYNDFLKAKGLPPITIANIQKYIGHILLTKASFDGETLSYHMYILDKDQGIARLLQSSSLFRKTNDKSTINLIGYANRGLHYYDMQTLKDGGYITYDFGGLYLSNGDIQKMNIDKFKLSFAPLIVRQYNYESIGLLIKPFYLFSHIIGKIISKMRK